MYEVNFCRKFADFVISFTIWTRAVGEGAREPPSARGGACFSRTEGTRQDLPQGKRVLPNQTYLFIRLKHTQPKIECQDPIITWLYPVIIPKYKKDHHFEKRLSLKEILQKEKWNFYQLSNSSCGLSSEWIFTCYIWNESFRSVLSNWQHKNSLKGSKHFIQFHICLVPPPLPERKLFWRWI